VSPRFFFDVSDGENTLTDQAGIDAFDLDEVLVEAKSVITEMADEVTEANPDQSWALIVRDEAGSVVGRLPIER
jgi:hypothetical protein